MRSTFIFLIIFPFFQSRSQTLTQVFNEPVVGDVDKNYSLDTSLFTSGLPINVTGNNAVWDFTKAYGKFPMIIDSIINPSAAPGASLFPSATFVQNRGGIYSFFFSNPSPPQTEFVGAWSPSLSITFTNSALVATYPVTFGYSLIDPVSGTFKYNSNNGACNGSITVEADGLGTLNFPNNVTFTNVLRLKSVEQLTMSIGIFPAGSIRQNIYSYYIPGKKYPILSINYQKYQLIAGQPTITAICYGNSNYFTVAGASENSFDRKINVYPNPFHDKLLLGGVNRTEEREFIFFDLNGRIIQQVKSLDDLETEKLCPGIYILQIKERSGSVYKKMTKVDSFY
jgi:hypothetical protein